jgi:hypothetical protein
MIPKALFISFLSISLPGQLSRVARYEAPEASTAVVGPVEVTVGGAAGSVPELRHADKVPVQPQANMVEMLQTPLVLSATDNYHETGTTEIDVSALLPLPAPQP